VYTELEMPSKTFYKVTNKDIYEKIESLIEDNNKSHEEIIKHQVETNGKVKLNKWIASTAMMFILATAGVLANHLLG